MSTHESPGPDGTAVGSSTLPTFLIIGAMKAGTTSLWRYVKSHPEVYTPDLKEIHFFSKRRDDGVEWYSRQFEGAGSARAIGEASPSYSAFPSFCDVPARIAEVVPDVKLVYVVRHPIERMRSHYVQVVADRMETRPIGEALLADPDYLDRSRYAFQIQQYLPFFTRDQMLIVASEQLREARRTTLQRVFRFLGVSAGWWEPGLEAEFNPSSSKGLPNTLNKKMKPIRRTRTYRTVASKAPRFVRTLNRRIMIDRVDRGVTIPVALRRHLEDLVRDDVRDLRALLGADFDGWGLV